MRSRTPLVGCIFKSGGSDWTEDAKDCSGLLGRGTKWFRGVSRRLCVGGSVGKVVPFYVFHRAETCGTRLPKISAY